MAHRHACSASLIASLSIAAAAVGFGSVPYFAKTLTDSGMAAQAIAFYRYLLVAVVLSPFLFVGSKAGSKIAWGVLAGAAMGVGWTGYVMSIALIPISTAGVIYMSYPVFTVVIACLWFRQSFTARSLAASAMIVAAALMVSAPSQAHGDHESGFGLLFALIAPVTFAFAVNVLASKLEGISPLSRVAGLAFGAVIGLLPLVLPLAETQMLPESASDLWKIAGIGLVTALIPQLLYVSNAPLIGAQKSAMLGGIELPTMILIGWLAFGEPLSPGQFIAASLVLLAVTVTPSTPSQS